MPKLICKGTVLNVEISAVMTPVAQLLDFEVGAQDPETFEPRTLDGGVAVGNQATGYTVQNNISGNVFYDPDDSVQHFLATNSQTPGTEVDGQVVLTDAGSTTLTFTAAAIGLGPLSVAMADGLKAGFVIKPAGLVTFPTS